MPSSRSVVVAIRRLRSDSSRSPSAIVRSRPRWIASRAAACARHARREPRRELARPTAHVVGGFHQPAAHEVGEGEGVTRHEQSQRRGRHAREARQPLRAAPAREQPEADLRERERGARPGDAHVGREQQLGTRPHRRSVPRHHGGGGERAEHRGRVTQPRRRRRSGLLGTDPGERGEQQHARGGSAARRSSVATSVAAACPATSASGPGATETVANASPLMLARSRRSCRPGHGSCSVLDDARDHVDLGALLGRELPRDRWPLRSNGPARATWRRRSRWPTAGLLASHDSASSCSVCPCVSRVRRRAARRPSMRSSERNVAGHGRPTPRGASPRAWSSSRSYLPGQQPAGEREVRA